METPGDPPTGEHDDPGDGDGQALEEGIDVPGRRRIGLIVSLVVIVVAVGLVWVLATSESSTGRQASSPLVGRVAPPLAGRTIDGGDFDIDNHQGRWVVVNIFATWCIPCQREHPELIKFDETHRRTGDAKLVSVLFDDDPAAALRYFQREGGEWPVVLDRDARIATDYGVGGVPETYLIHPNGRVVTKLIGGVTQEDLDDAIQQAEEQTAGGDGDEEAGS